ncbi:MAG: ribosome-associated translation inhibitor RaiA [bacterium]
MQINITGKGLDITPAIRDYAQKKVIKLEEFYNNIQKVEVVLETSDIHNLDKAQRAEIRAWLAGKKVIQAIAGARDIYAAIDLALDEAKHQVQKFKEKRTDKQRRHASEVKREIRSGLGETAL